MTDREKDVERLKEIISRYSHKKQLDILIGALPSDMVRYLITMNRIPEKVK